MTRLLCWLFGHDITERGEGHRGLFPWERCGRCGAARSGTRTRAERDLEA